MCKTFIHMTSILMILLEEGPFAVRQEVVFLWGSDTSRPVEIEVSSSQDNSYLFLHLCVYGNQPCRDAYFDDKWHMPSAASLKSRQAARPVCRRVHQSCLSITQAVR